MTSIIISCLAVNNVDDGSFKFFLCVSDFHPLGHVKHFHRTVREFSAIGLESSEMALDALCRGWNSVRVKFWSIGYKKRLILQFGVLLFIVLSGLFLWSSLFANLSDLKVSQKQKGNVSTPWDKWVKDNDLQSIGDIWDGCGKSFVTKLSSPKMLKKTGHFWFYT